MRPSSLARWVLSSFLLALSVQAYADGGGSMVGGGGGNGVACFESESAKNAALRSDGSIKAEYYDRIVSLKTLDLWEYQLSAPLFSPKDQERPYDYLMRVLGTDWAPFMPELVSKIKEVSPAVRGEINDQNVTTDSAPIRDYGPLDKTIDKECTIVGIAHRKSVSVEGHYPRVEIRWNKALYDKLIELNGEKEGIVNQAALRLHELLYVLGFEMGDHDSYRSRALTRLLLSTEFNGQLQRDKSDRGKINIALNILEGTFHLNDILGLFSKEYSPVGGLAGRNQSRNTSWHRLNDIGMRCQDQVMRSKKLKFPMNEAELKAVMDTTGQCMLHSDLTDEQAFLLAASGIAVVGMISSTNSLIASGEDPTVALGGTCRFLLGKDSRDENTRAVLKQAKNYCLGLGLGF